MGIYTYVDGETKSERGRRSQILYVEGENESLSLKGISVGADSGVDV